MDCLIISDGHTAKYSNHLFDHLEAQVRWIQLSNYRDLREDINHNLWISAKMIAANLHTLPCSMKTVVSFKEIARE